MSDLLTILQRRRVAILTTQQRTADLANAVPVAAINAQDEVALNKEGLGVRSLGPFQDYQLTQTKTVKVVRFDPDSVELARGPIPDGDPRVAPLPDDLRGGRGAEGQVRRGRERLDKIIFTTRSILEVMYVLSKTVNVPREHIEAGLAPVTRNPDGSPFDWRMVSGDLFRVCVAKHRPSTAFVAVRIPGVLVLHRRPGCLLESDVQPVQRAAPPPEDRRRRRATRPDFAPGAMTRTMTIARRGSRPKLSFNALAS